MPPTRSPASAPTPTPNPDEPWILGGGWSMDHYPGGAPIRGLLDEVVPDRPVLLLSRDHHSTWANSAAIRLAGIDASTPDPADGRIEREADGSPAGTFHEGAGDLFDGVRPPVDPDLAYAGLLRAQRELLALGITGWQDAMVGGSIGGVPDPIDAYRRALRRGRARRARRRRPVVGADRGIEQVDEMTARRDAVAALGREDRLSLGTTKIMVDGVAENQTAAMLDALPRRARARHPQPRTLVRRPGAAAGLRHGPRRRRIPGALPRPRRPCGARGARRARRRPGGERRHRRPAPPRAPAGGRGDRDRPIRRARRRREHPGALGDPRGPDRRAHPALPAGRRRGPAVPVRRPRAPRRTPRRRQRLARVERRPDGRDPHRGQPGRARNRCRAARRRPPAPRPRHGDGRVHVGHPPT